MKNIIPTDTAIKYVLQLADSPLILGQRLAEWCGHGPILEQDMALTNISLDLIGQARLFYQYAAELSDRERTEDHYAYWRTSEQFYNVLLVEHENEDFAVTIARQLFWSQFSLLLYEQLLSSSDKRIRDIAEKSLKELKYHVKYASEWTVRLGDGTEESHKRMLRAIDRLWRYTPEMWTPNDVEQDMYRLGIAPKLRSLEEPWMNSIQQILDRATLPLPEPPVAQLGGKRGIHTERLSYLLGEMQVLQRSYPSATW